MRLEHNLMTGEVTEHEDAPVTSLIPATVAVRKAEKQSEIDALEASQYMTRGEREGWLALIEAQAATQNASLEALYATNLFYKKLRDVNAQITTLRTELKEIT